MFITYENLKLLVKILGLLISFIDFIYGIIKKHKKKINAKKGSIRVKYIIYFYFVVDCTSIRRTSLDKFTLGRSTIHP